MKFNIPIIDRPNLLLTVFSQVFDKVMYSRLSHHVHSNKILVPEKYGFIQRISTEDAALRVTDNI
jgi:hypothetical protein